MSLSPAGRRRSLDIPITCGDIPTPAAHAGMANRHGDTSCCSFPCSHVETPPTRIIVQTSTRNCRLFRAELRDHVAPIRSVPQEQPPFYRPTSFRFCLFDAKLTLCVVWRPRLRGGRGLWAASDRSEVGVACGRGSPWFDSLYESS